MAVLLFKLFTLVCRTMARPLISYVTYYNRVKLQSSNGRFQNKIKVKLVTLGQHVEFIVYAILITLPIYELVKLSKANTEKENEKENKMRKMRNELNHLVVENESIINELDDIKNLVMKLRVQIADHKITNKL